MRKLAVIVVAFASLAMARRWVVSVPLPYSDMARIVEVESSEYASLHGGARPLTTPTTYPGTATFFVPAGRAGSFEVDGICGGCSKCEVPKNTFVRITSAKYVAMWRLEASKEHDALLEADKEMRTTFSITASTEPTFRVDGDEGGIRDTVYGGGNDRMAFWIRPPRRMLQTITAHASIVGPCTSEEPCQPPPDAKLEITKIVTEVIAPPK